MPRNLQLNQFRFRTTEGSMSARDFIKIFLYLDPGLCTASVSDEGVLSIKKEGQTVFATCRMCWPTKRQEPVSLKSREIFSRPSRMNVSNNSTNSSKSSDNLMSRGWFRKQFEPPLYLLKLPLDLDIPNRYDKMAT